MHTGIFIHQMHNADRHVVRQPRTGLIPYLSAAPWALHELKGSTVNSRRYWIRVFCITYQLRSKILIICQWKLSLIHKPSQLSVCSPFLFTVFLTLFPPFWSLLLTELQSHILLIILSVEASGLLGAHGQLTGLLNWNSGDMTKARCGNRVVCL